MDQLKIIRVRSENYHLYDDMVYWRINKKERTEEEKKSARNNIDNRVCEELKNENFYVFAAETSNKFVGWIHVIYMPKIGIWSNGVLYVDELWVTPEFRNNGIANELCERVNELQLETRADRIRLYTDNPIAQKVYEKCGWRVTNECVFIESSPRKY